MKKAQPTKTMTTKHNQHYNHKEVPVLNNIFLRSINVITLKLFLRQIWESFKFTQLYMSNYDSEDKS